MKVRITLLSVFLCFALVLCACGVSKTVAPADASSATSNQTPEVEATNAPEEKAPEIKGTYKTIGEFSEAWNELYKLNEEPINNYEGMPVMALVTPPLGFLTGIQYDLLNMEGKNGRFEGNLMLAGYKGFVEKSGGKLTFGHDDIDEKDGFTSADKAGDRKVENGSCDLDKGHYVTEKYTERNGKKIKRYYYEFKRLADGSMMCFEFSGSAIDYNGNEENKNEFSFMRIGNNRLEFVTAKAEIGTEFDIITLVDKGELTKEKVIELFKNAGYSIEKTGGNKDGKFVLD